MSTEVAAPELIIMRDFNHPSGGDTRHTWNPDDPTEVAEMREMFSRMQKNGYVGYTVVAGEASEVIREFNPRLGKVIMRPAVVGG